MAKPRRLTWRELLEFQDRVVSRQQAGQYGLTTAAISRRVRSGSWQRLQRGAYATFSGLPSRDARLWGAVLRAGPGAVLSHETAAEVHRLIDKPRGKIHITVPAARDPARRHAIPGVVVHRSRNVVSQYLPPWELPRTPVAETLLDLVAAARTFDDAYNWLVLADGRGLLNLSAVKAALAARKRMRWRAWVLDALPDAANGISSPLERRYVEDVERAHGLPAAQRQARRELAAGVRYLDNYYPGFRLCVELDGRLSHPPEQKWRDADRDSDNLFLDDVQTIRLGLPHVTAHRCEQAARLATLFIRRGWNAEGLRACSPGCAVGNLLTSRETPQGTHTPRGGLASQPRSN